MSGPVCLRPADCWDWLTPDDLLQHALAAYYGARASIAPPPGEPWRDRETGMTWAGRGDFRDVLLGLLVQRINAHGLPRGLTAPESLWPELADGLEWPDRDAVAESGAGRSPAVKGHGCPASAPGACPPASAVGPAPMPYPEAARSAAANECDITDPENPLFCASALQKLPEVNTEVNLDTEGEKIA